MKLELEELYVLLETLTHSAMNQQDPLLKEMGELIHKELLGKDPNFNIVPIAKPTEVSMTEMEIRSMYSQHFPKNGGSNGKDVETED